MEGREKMVYWRLRKNRISVKLLKCVKSYWKEEENGFFFPSVSFLARRRCHEPNQKDTDAGKWFLEEAVEIPLLEAFKKKWKNTWYIFELIRLLQALFLLIGDITMKLERWRSCWWLFGRVQLQSQTLPEAALGAKSWAEPTGLGGRVLRREWKLWTEKGISWYLTGIPVPCGSTPVFLWQR